MDFNMKSGVLGITVVAVIIGAAILLTVTLDVNEQEYERVEYKYITDTTSLFDSDKTPQYLDYDLVKSYTNYYTDETEPYLGGVGEKDSGYYTTSTVSRYTLNIAPTAAYSDTVDLTAQSYTDVYTASGMDVRFLGPDGTLNIENWATSPKNVSLSSIISGLNLTNYTKITITPTSDSITDRILFIDKSDLKIYEALSYTHYGAQYTDISDLTDYPTWTYHGTTYSTMTGALSCVYDYTTDLVYLYSSTDASTTSFIRTIEMDNAIVIFGGTQYFNYNAWGTTAVINAVILPEAQYLDISQGVRISTDN